MICSKCNNELPDNVKFCPNCGALCETAAGSKTFCSNCGLELPKGAKFCTVCGASAVSDSSDKAVPVSEPIDLSKNAGKSATEMSYAVPTPTAYSAPQTAGSMPAADFIPNEVTAGSSTSSGFSAPTTGYSSPSYTAENPFADFGNSAAAVAVAPIKKKSIKKPLIITICSVIGALLTAAGIIFLVNRQFFFTLFLGKSGYAAMVEGNSIRSITSNIDMSAVSDSIKSASPSVADQISSLYSSYYDATGVSPTSSTVMNSSMSSMSAVRTIDFKDLIRTYNEAIKETYGSNNIKFTIKSNAELTDTAKALLKSDGGLSESDINDMLEIINGIGISSEIVAAENDMSMFVEGKAGSLVLNCKVVIDDNGNVYLQVPFATDKAISVNIGSTTAASSVQDIYLELDEKELKRITDKLVNVYIDAYKSSEVTIDEGTISAGGVTANGKLIRANLTGSKLTEMFKKIGDALGDDSYLCGKISAFMTECGLPVSEAQVKSSFKMIFSMMSVPDNCGIVIDTITDSNCRVLAKSYDVVSYDSSIMKFTVVGDFDTEIKNGDKAAVSMEVGGTDLYITVNKESDTDGVMNFSISTKGETIGLNLKYSGIKKTVFFGKPAYEGTYEISAALPKDFTQDYDIDMDMPIEEIVNSAKIIVTSKVDGNILNESYILDLSKYGKISFEMSVSAGEGDKSAEIPSNTVDVTEYMYSGNLPENVKNEIIGIIKDMKNAVQSQNAGEFGEIVESALEGVIESAESGPKVDIYDVNDLLNEINDDSIYLKDYVGFYANDIDKEEIVTKANQLIVKLDSLYYDVYDDINNMSQKAFDDYEDRFSDLHNQAQMLLDEFDSEQSGWDVSSAENIDFNTLDTYDLMFVLIEYENRYSDAISSRGFISISNPSVEALADSAEEAYETAADDFNNYMDKYNAGHMELGLLRQSRKSAKAFALAVEELEEALRENV